MSKPAHTTARFVEHAKKILSAVDHLSPEQVAAYVDVEMDPASRRRAHQHIADCTECDHEVRKQQAAADALAHCNTLAEVQAPDDLLRKLFQIARRCEPGPDASETPCPQPDGVLDRIETLIRAVKNTPH